VPVIVISVLLVELFGLRHALWVYANQEHLARAAIEIFPDGPDGWEWLGNVYMDRGDLETARECYRKATERGPQLFRPRHNFAMALYYTGSPAEALEQLQILETLHPPTAPGEKVAVLALMELGRWDEAAVRLIESLDREPGDPGLAEVAARLLAAHPRPETLRAWLASELEKPEHEGSARVIGPMLSSSG
jgi:tetratricopeptide (TPR) repeat protein